jgi:predicted ATPase
VFEDLRRRFIAGINHPGTATLLEAQATQIQAALAGAGLQAGEAKLPQGVFWQTSDVG